MTIYSCGYYSKASAEKTEAFDVFVQNLALIRQHEGDILERGDYFFCKLPFAYCSWPYISGDGPLCLGYLILGWRSGLFIEPCPKCNSECVVTSFGGSPVSGSNSWTGYCCSCKTNQSAKGSIHEPFYKKVMFVMDLRKQYPEIHREWIEVDGVEFSFGGTGLRPARKKQLASIELFDPASLQELLGDLAGKAMRPKNPPKRIP